MTKITTPEARPPRRHQREGQQYCGYCEEDIPPPHYQVVIHPPKYPAINPSDTPITPLTKMTLRDTSSTYFRARE